MPEWLLTLAEDSDRMLSSLPVASQPSWYRQFDEERKLGNKED